MESTKPVLLLGLDRETRDHVSDVISAAEGLRREVDRTGSLDTLDPETLVVLPVGLLSEVADAVDDCASLDVLTERQREVAARVADGRTNQEIADELDLSSNTVRNYLARAMDRLDARNRVDIATLVARCLQRLRRVLT